VRTAGPGPRRTRLRQAAGPGLANPRAYAHGGATDVGGATCRRSICHAMQRKRNAAPMPIDDTNTTRLRNQLPWAPVLLNPQRLAFAAIGAVRHGANYTSQLASIVTGGSPIGPKKGDWRFADLAFTDHPICRRTHLMRLLKRQRGITHSTWNDLWGWSVHVRQRRDRQMWPTGIASLRAQTVSRKEANDATQ
jgi:hypothetical protein